MFLRNVSNTRLEDRGSMPIVLRNVGNLSSLPHGAGTEEKKDCILSTLET
jgi:hypothetical protein